MAFYPDRTLDVGIQQAAAQRYAKISEFRDLGRLVCCSDGNFRPPIAAEAFERGHKGRS